MIGMVQPWMVLTVRGFLLSALFADITFGRVQPNHEILIKLVTTKMPFGKYKDTLLSDLPVSYLEWFERKGFPKGKLGEQLQILHTIKTNGLQHILTELKRMQ